MFTIYKIEYKGLVYYGCTKRFNARVREHYTSLFSISGAIRRNDLKCIRNKSLYEISKKLCDTHRWAKIVPFNVCFFYVFFHFYSSISG